MLAVVREAAAIVPRQGSGGSFLRYQIIRHPTGDKVACTESSRVIRAGVVSTTRKPEIRNDCSSEWPTSDSHLRPGRRRTMVVRTSAKEATDRCQVVWAQDLLKAARPTAP